MRGGFVHVGFGSVTLSVRAVTLEALVAVDRTRGSQVGIRRLKRILKVRKFFGDCPGLELIKGGMNQNQGNPEQEPGKQELSSS